MFSSNLFPNNNNVIHFSNLSFLENILVELSVIASEPKQSSNLFRYCKDRSVFNFIYLIRIDLYLF